MMHGFISMKSCTCTGASFQYIEKDKAGYRASSKFRATQEFPGAEHEPGNRNATCRSRLSYGWTHGTASGCRMPERRECTAIFKGTQLIFNEVTVPLRKI
jgi:hypothetical protein